LNEQRTRLVTTVALTAVAIMIGLMLGGCAQFKQEPIEHRAVTVRTPQPAARVLPVHGAIYQAGPGAPSLFEDRRPREVGDILTVLVRENVNASKSSGTNTNRSSDVSLNIGLIPKLLGSFLSPAQNASVSGENTLSAGGDANASNQFNGVITVTVVEVLANGNLLVSGEKQMLINQGTEFIRFSGVVNPRTVGAANTVLSTQVADARMEYSAKGFIDEAQTMGWLQRFFLNVLPL
jgi:flagellar L-ring protein precursor FlgH